jgi:hypothetical protein
MGAAFTFVMAGLSSQPSIDQRAPMSGMKLGNLQKNGWPPQTGGHDDVVAMAEAS